MDRRLMRSFLLALIALVLALVPGVAYAATTGGSGGAFTNRLNQSFSSGGMTSTYHVYASGINTTKPIGLLMYADGSGGYGFDHPSSTYLLAGTNGLVNVAKQHNYILVVPNAPAPNCNGTGAPGASYSDNCWFNTSGTPTSAQKAAWSSALMTKIKGQYNIELNKVAIGGYSSGAQWASELFMPQFGEAQSVDLAIMISFGGQPISAPNFSAAYKGATVLTWDVGTADASGGYSTSPSGGRGGYTWYTNAGFKTDHLWVTGEDHYRDGQFGGIVNRELTQWLP